MCITQYISICGYREHKDTSQYPQIYFLFPHRDFMDPTMDNTKHILNYLMPIIERVNPEVHDFMQQ